MVIVGGLCAVKSRETQRHSGSGHLPEKSFKAGVLGSVLPPTGPGTCSTVETRPYRPATACPELGSYCLPAKAAADCSRDSRF
jgi:hypothetical protein